MNTGRREEIEKMIRQNGEVSLEQLGDIFTGCSTMTLRRDLIYFENKGLVKRTRGGCIALKQISSSIEDVLSVRALENIDKKKALAFKACNFLQAGQSVFMDSGTTLVFFAKEIPDNYFNIVTTGPAVALELSKKLNPYITLTGGQLNRNTLSISGLDAIDFVRNTTVDIAFLSAAAFSTDAGFTCEIYPECELKREVISHSRQVIMLIDSTKADKNMPYTFARLNDIDALVSDDGLPQDIKILCEKQGVIVL